MKEELEAFIQRITREAGDAILPLYGHTGVKSTKRDAGDVLTEADLKAEKIIVEAIRETYPEHGIIAEEGGRENESAEWVWIIDPIDGTRNFATGTPHWGVIVGLAHKGEMQLGCIYLPVTGEFCFAGKGKGAYLNGKRVQCSAKEDLAFSYGNTTTFIRESKLHFFSALLDMSKKHAFNMNTTGSSAVNSLYVASGRRDWYVALDGSVWDYAAPVLIMQEAGCTVTKHDGTPWKLGDTGTVSANPSLHRELLKKLKE